MREFLKENRREVVILVLMVIVLLGGMIHLLSMLKISCYAYPQSTLTQTAIETTVPVDTEFSQYSYLCPYTPYGISTPVELTQRKEIMEGSYDGMDILIFTKESEDMEAVLTETVSEILCPAILTKKPKVDIMVQDDGYCYGKAASYCAALISSKISFQTIKYFVLTYEFQNPEGNSAYLCVSGKDFSKLKYAKEVLDKIAGTLSYVSYTDEDLLNMMEQIKQDMNMGSEE